MRGFRRSSPHFSFIIGETTEKPAFSVVVSKKVAKKAVLRNRTRRRVYRSLSEVLKKTTLPPVIVFARRGAESLNIHDMLSELESVFRNNSVS
jgi:ribonuclease P protein component